MLDLVTIVGTIGAALVLIGFIGNRVRWWVAHDPLYVVCPYQCSWQCDTDPLFILDWQLSIYDLKYCVAVVFTEGFVSL